MGTRNGARGKLNSAYVNGALLIAGVAGGLAGSWAVFGIAFVGLVVSNLMAGKIRLSGKR